MSTKRILLTGAAGRIASAFREDAGERYWFRLADRVTEKLTTATAQGHDVLALDIADPVACQAACRDIDTIIHLAADPSPGASFYSSLLDNNIKGVYNIFQAAKDQGCQRVIFASSIHTVLGYSPDMQIFPNMPVRPANMYGVSKCFGEAVASYFAYSEGLSSIAIRIGWFNEDPQGHPDARSMSRLITKRDMNQLLIQCIEVPNIPFAIVHGISDNLFKQLDLSETKKLLNYQPQDDAFKIFNVDLHE